MKIGILTLPLLSNYGGILQAWALQHTLKNMGHQAVHIMRHAQRQQDRNAHFRIASEIKQTIISLIKGIPKPLILSEIDGNYLRQNTIKFIEEEIFPKSNPIYSDGVLKKYYKNHEFDAMIVGSDQIWRPAYSQSLKNLYLDFVEDPGVKKISYAASFGTDRWEYSAKEERICKKLIKTFDFIGVREHSAVNLVKEHFDCQACIVADPTLLLDKEDYLNLLKTSTCPIHESRGSIFTYILDVSDQTKKIVNKCCEVIGKEAYNCRPSRIARTKEDLKFIDECVAPPVEQWIQSFEDAELLITDSFHGTVFSIIFNRPFWVIVNSKRGADRFISLLSTFDLQNRIITNTDNIDWKEPIDWRKVNKKREEIKSMSLGLLRSALKD